MSNTIINNSKSINYVSGQKIFILGKITAESTAEIIGNISNMVDSLPWAPVYTPQQHKIDNPYKIKPDNNPVIDVYINSNGGNLDQTKSILALLNLARAKGAIIRTTVIGQAASCASLIAIQGTPNFRIMYEQAYNLCHYGHTTIDIDRIYEIEKAAQYEQEMRTKFNEPYLKYTKLKSHELIKLQQTEFGHMNAEQCLAKHVCDWILTTNGILISRPQKQK